MSPGFHSEPSRTADWSGWEQSARRRGYEHRLVQYTCATTQRSTTSAPVFATLLPCPTMRPAGSDDVASLLEAAGRGESAAFEEFFDATQRLVRGIILRVVRDRALAEEVTQDVYLELWRQAPRFEKDRGSARSWTTTIAHRRAVDRVRSEQARRDRELRHELVVDLTTDPADELGDAAEQARVRDALDQLTSIQREAIKLAYYEGNTYQQVARLLDIPEGTAKTRIRDGLVKLRDALGVSP